MNYEQFITYLSGWCAYRADFFKYLWPLKGGWEAWAQADLAAYIIKTIGETPIQREYPANNQRIDLFFGDDVNNGLFVEIKCQSFGNWDMFTNGLTNDVNKLTDLQNVANQNNLSIQTAVMGIGFEQTALQYLLNNGYELVHYESECVCGVKRVPAVNNFLFNNNQQTNNNWNDPFQNGNTGQNPFLMPPQ